MAGTSQGSGFFAGFRAAVMKIDGIRLRAFLVGLLVLAGVFWGPLTSLARLAAGSELYSHVFLIPFISLYLIALRSRDLPTSLSTSWRPALCFVALGAILLFGFNWLISRGW